MAKYCCGRIPKIGIYKLARNNAMSEESLTIGQVGVRLAGVGGCIIPRSERSMKVVSDVAK